MKHGRCAVVRRWRVHSCTYVDFFPPADSVSCVQPVCEWECICSACCIVIFCENDDCALVSGSYPKPHDLSPVVTMFRNSGSLFAESSMSCATSRCSCFCSIISSFGMNFADSLCKAKSLVKMECTEPVLIPTSSASSWMVTQWSCMTKVWTWSMSLLFWLVEGLPERASLSTDVRPSLNQLYHSLICVMPMASSLKTCWIFWMVSTWLSPSFWQNLMQYCCSSRCIIFAENNNATRAAYTFSLTRWLHATDAVCTLLTLSAGRKKSTYAHEDTLNLPTTAHLLCFISFRGKNHVGYFLNSPHMHHASLLHVCVVYFLYRMRENNSHESWMPQTLIYAVVVF